jgi:hypothetical protein
MKFKVVGICLFMVMLLCAGCAGGKYQTMYGLTNWYYLNHKTIESQYANADAETKAWYEEKVNPYMNVFKQAIIGMDAIDRGDNVKAAACASKITLMATGIAYDASKLAEAIVNKDYDAMLAEMLVLKNIIIQKLSERS